MKKYCVIGARGGSKGIPDKNIQLINGKSLLSIAVEKAIKANIFDKIFVSSDKASYMDELPENINVEFILRPPEISGDEAIEQEYLAHVVEEKKLSHEGIIARMQCTSPFQSVSSIVDAVKLLIEKSNSYDSVQLITPASPSIYKALTLDTKSRYLQAAVEGGSIGPSNRQRLPKTYFRSNFYVTHIKNVVVGDLMGRRSYGLECDPKEKIDIDNELDLHIARIIADSKPEWLF